MNLFNEHVPSDHRALFLDVCLPNFEGGPSPLAAAQHRSIGTDSKNVACFVSMVHSHLANNNSFRKLTELSSTVASMDQPWIQANKLDDVLGQALKLADKFCTKKQRPVWSLALHTASLKVRYWHTALSGKLTGVSQDSVLASLAPKIWTDTTPPSTPRNLRALRNLLRASQC